MRVLWFANTSVGCPGEPSSVGGGWMNALASAFRRRSGIDLGVAFFGTGPRDFVEDGSIAYYPLVKSRTPLSRLFRFFRLTAQDASDLAACRRVIERFRPDVIHVFGTERCFGLLCGRSEIPVVIHLQGLMGPTLNAWVPPGYAMRDCVFASGISPIRAALSLRAIAFNRHAAEREREILSNCRFVMGRTAWDSAFASLYAPRARYFHCDEALRPFFLEAASRTVPARAVFVSTLSGPLYKGHDVLLKTAKVLCETGHGDFEWRVFGVDQIRFAERKTGIRADSVHVRTLGKVPPERLRDELLVCTAYVHPSYVDNSPNSVCEAQVLGVPVVATNVGGVASIVEEGRTGFLVPANDPVAMATRMLDVVSGRATLPPGWTDAVRERHDPDRVAARVLDIYQSVRALSLAGGNGTESAGGRG